jgi:hypothetical protein
MRRNFCSENLNAKDHVEYPGVDQRAIIKLILRNVMWSGLKWLMIGTGGGFF